MNKDYLESLERLAMPDELHAEECRKLGIGLTEDYDVVEQALLELKSIKESKPKHYLKWEDLVFTVDWKVMTVKMGDTVYKILYRYCYANEEVQLLSEDKKLLCFRLIGRYKYNIQLFNDLHLERVKEE